MSAKVVINTKGGPLTEDDFVSDPPAPGSSDKKYTALSQNDFKKLSERVSKLLSFTGAKT